MRNKKERTIRVLEELKRRDRNRLIIIKEKLKPIIKILEQINK